VGFETACYSGSLTTPPFTEGVTWINLAQPLEMAASQIQAYQELFPEGNTRPVQPLGDRIILTDVPGFVTNVPEPQTYAMLLPGLGAWFYVAWTHPGVKEAALEIRKTRLGSPGGFFFDATQAMRSSSRRSF
jgi:hypothetical protein